MIYLDNAATTYPKPEEVYSALDHANRELAFNAGRGSYKKAQEVSKMIKETKQMLADLVNAEESQVSLESSATEALNIIINGLCFHDGDTVFVSPFEHNAIVRPLYNIKTQIDLKIELIPFDQKTWELDAAKFNDMLAMTKPAAVFVSHISNVTGYILPYEQIFAIAKTYHAVTVLDCSQSFGVLNPKMDYVDIAVFAGHKSLYASFGIAGFINAGNIRLNVTKSGGTGSDSLNHYMPDSGGERYESGSPNSVAIVGLHESLKWLKTHPVYAEEKELTDYLIKKLRTLDNLQIYVPENTDSIFGVISINVAGMLPSDVGIILSEEYDICIRTGYHCSPFIHKFIGSEDSLGTVRISLSAFTTKEEIDSLCRCIEEIML